MQQTHTHVHEHMRTRTCSKSRWRQGPEVAAAAAAETAPDGGRASECNICTTQMPSLKQEKGVDTQHSVAAFALIEWKLYGIHAWSVWIVSNLNQKKKSN